MDRAKIEATSRLEAKQRAMERRIRQAKREAEGLQDEQAAKEARREVRRLQKQLKAFVDTHGDVLRRDPWRERYDGVKAQLPQFEQQDFENKPVTMQSIAAIKPVPSQLLSPENQKRLANVHKKLLMTVYKSPIGTEYGECYTLNMERLTPQPRVGELPGRVRLPDFDQPYIAIHNHPDGLTFSVGDIRQMLKRPNLKMLTAVGNNGHVYVMEKTTEFDDEKLREMFGSLANSYPDYLVDPEEHLKLSEEFLRKAEQYGLKYYSRTDKGI